MVWTEFEAELAAWMKTFARPSLKFCHGRQCIPGFPSDGFRADGALTNGRVLIALEVEARQQHPDTNVGKYWLLAQHYQYTNVVLFHIYTPAFSSYPWRKTLGEFYASKISAELPFEYVLLDKRQATDFLGDLDEVRAIIESRIRQEFAHELS
jgi:hypothetical protein